MKISLGYLPVATLAAFALVTGLGVFGVPRVGARTADQDTHGRDATPDYARVFNQEQVGRLDVTITASDWQVLVDDMISMAGPQGGQTVGGPGPGGIPNPGPGGGGGGPVMFPQEAIAACTGLMEGSACSYGTPPVSGRCVQTGNAAPLACIPLAGGGQAPNPGGGGNQPRDDVELFPRTPAYIPADVTFDGETFRHVAFRLKGNSSLATSWRSGTDKLPFRLNIDGLESRFPESKDQTFFGFTNLSFSNNALDSSYLRAKVVTDLFRDAGLPVARTAFMRVFLDRGAGASYLGLYTMIEVPGGPMLRGLFASDNGNLYKPHSTGGRWTVFIKENFPKKTNDTDEDWTDIEGAIAALNASKTDRALWRSRLEARFDVNSFLRWLALNTMVGNTDAYGGLSAHNYYLYGSPRHRDRLFWIPWDHDLAMSGGANLGGAGGGNPGGAGGAQTVDIFNNASPASWPLIRFLMDDPVYRAQYRAHVVDLLATVFEPFRVNAILQSEQARIAPFVIGREGELAGRSFGGTPAQFDASIYGPTGLLAYVSNRAIAIRRALATQ
jgi:spore coat protein H